MSGVPAGLFDLPDGFITDPELRVLHVELCHALKSEVPEADMLELMLLERTVTMLVYIRSEEKHGRVRGLSAYKDVMKLWLQTAADLRKTRTGVTNTEKVREQLSMEMIGALNKALVGLEPEVASTVRTRMLEAMDA